MPTLSTELRNKLEKVIIGARDVAEGGARATLEGLAVGHYEPYPHMSQAAKRLRNQLRARARQLGDRQDATGRLTIDHLAAECAYEHWHQMLFARFLAENNLLIEPQENIAISLEEAEELAKETGEDVWTFASRCAQRMLPQIFRPDDPLLQISFATEHFLKLERLLASLPQEAFAASDAMGWVYQFWQTKKKKEVNRSEVKIGADEIAAVTQLFTEPYMVNFLIHNTLGAWWAGKNLTAEDAENAETEEQLRKKLALPGVDWSYLRFVKTESTAEETEGRRETKTSEQPPRSSAPSAVKSRWRPAAGTFEGWPKAAAEIKVLDPCCGSGHFLVAALHHLVPIRMAEEGLSAAEAIDAVLSDNLHGLEIDERCCQIAAFALAFEAWKMTGYRQLPPLHIACTGIGPQATEEQWLKLLEQSDIPIPAIARDPIKNGLLNLHSLFSQAPTLGSLIDPTQLPADLIAADYETIQPYLTAILKAEIADDETRERAIAAAGMVKAADLLAGEYTLVITNVPYLGRGKQDNLLKAHLERSFKDGKADLATAFVLRCLECCSKAGTAALVTPQNWLFLGGYRKLRERLLKYSCWDVLARLGEHAFDSPQAAGAFVALISLSSTQAGHGHRFFGIDISSGNSAAAKATALRSQSETLLSQQEQLVNPDARVVIGYQLERTTQLGEFCECYQGIVTGDQSRFCRQFLELWEYTNAWVPLRASCDSGPVYSGVEQVLLWENGCGRLHEYARLTRDQLHDMHESGNRAWGRHGIAVNRMRNLRTTIYFGEHFENNLAVIVPRNPTILPAVWAFCSAPDFEKSVRALDQKVSLTNATLVKVPFDLDRWQKVAAKEYPDGLPEPESNGPTQWLFHGRPEESTAPLQVAVARLLGYRWPAELDDKMCLSKRARAMVKRCDELVKFVDDDGIVCIPSVRREEGAAEQILALLSACGLKPDKVRALAGGTDLDDWLRNSFFEEHCKLFHHRPFIWHIWDGRKRDGFHALVNYHKLAEGNGKGRKLLESLTYSYLGDWIIRQKDGVKQGEGGADDRLAAAMELQKRLEAILEGEPPFDLFVRWKPLHDQPIGWEPDINDGVRMNIRPFMASDISGGKKGAGILRWKPNIKWGKDRGKEPKRPKEEYPWFWGWDETTMDFMGTGKETDGNRWNNCHYTNKTKHATREKLTAEGAEGHGGKK